MEEPDEDGKEETAHEEHGPPWLYIAAILGSSLAASFLLDKIAGGVRLGFEIPFLGEPTSISVIIYHTTAIIIGGYIGILGLKELIFERKFSVEFLMALAALGAVYLHYHFEAATVLLLYSLAEYCARAALENVPNIFFSYWAYWVYVGRRI